MPPVRLADRTPEIAPAALVTALVPPPQFSQVRFATYRPDPDQPSQRRAVELLTAFAATVPPPRQSVLRRTLLHRPSGPAGVPGVYLDGGFGVGKTHLLASLWHAAEVPPARKAYASFVELTSLVGALGFAETVAALSDHRLLCIDEFELDDPGDTVLVSTLLSRLVEAGLRVAATSNTLPGQLGEGRFAAQDFHREIQGLSSQFVSVRVDGPDYRHRGMPDPPPPRSTDQLADYAQQHPPSSYDDFLALMEHLRRLHPVRYGALIEGLETVCVAGLAPAPDEAAALRIVMFTDRLYDAGVTLATSGVGVDELFSAEMLAGGYRKKYLRATSRLLALAR